jgi:hypothetical protein
VHSTHLLRPSRALKSIDTHPRCDGAGPDDHEQRSWPDERGRAKASEISILSELTQLLLRAEPARLYAMTPSEILTWVIDP